MKQSMRASRQVRARIRTFKEEIEKLPEYVMREIQIHPTELERFYMVSDQIGDMKEHERSIRW